jgi:polysaccharide chain length determinant protein (PEP-CTERM system associated)
MAALFEQLLSYIRFAVQRHWIILLVTWLLCLVGWAVITLLPDSYTSEVRIRADADNALMPMLTGVIEDQLTPTTESDVVEDVLLSRPVLAAVVERTDYSSDRIEAINELEDGIVIESEGSDFYRVSFSHPDPAVSHAVVNGLIGAVLGDGVGTDDGERSPARRYIQGQLDIKREQMEEARRALAAYQKDNVDLLAGQTVYLANLDAARERLNDLDSDLQAAIARRNELTRRLEQVPRRIQADAVAGAPLPAGSPSAQLQLLTRELAEMRSRLTDQHPDVIATERAIETLRDQIAAGGGGTTGTAITNPLRVELERDLLELEAEIVGIENRRIQAREIVDRQTSRASDLPESEAELARLTSEYEGYRSQFEALRAREESARLFGDLEDRRELVSIEVVDPAVRPAEPSGPNRPLLMVAVLLFGMITGIVVAMLKGALDDPFDTPHRLRMEYGLPVLGSITRTQPPEHAEQRRMARLTYVCACLSLLVILAGLVIADQSRLFEPLRADTTITDQRFEES